MGRKVLAVVVGVALVLSLAGIALGATSQVRARGERWKPKHDYIGRGDRVRWRNPTSRTHDIKAYGGGWRFSKILPPGSQATKRFRQRGTYRYRCVRHSAIVGGKCRGMCGLVHVVS
jgi:plastocyanin